MRIPHKKLSRIALQGIVGEFVTRDGTDHSDVTQRVLDVIKQLENGEVELYFDDPTGTCNIISISE